MLRIVIIIMFSFLLTACSAERHFDASAQPLAPTLRHWVPENPPSDVVLALHSFGDHGAAFQLLGPQFANAGIYLESYDQAGFGSRQFEGRWAGETQLVNEAAERIEHLASVYHQPVYVMGESLGAAVAILAACKNPDAVAGVILSAPAVREGIRFRYGWNLAIASAATLAPGYEVQVQRDPEAPLLAPSQAQRLATDERVMRQVRLDSYWGLIQLADSASDQAAVLSQTKIPVLILYGDRDNTVPEAGIVTLRRHLQPQVTYLSVPDGPHLLLQGKDWRTTSQQILDWIQTQRPANHANIAAPATPRSTTIGSPSQLHTRSD